MRVVATKAFRDIEANVTRDVGDMFDVTEERYAAINGTKYGRLAEIVPDERPRRRRAKAEEPTQEAAEG